MMIAKNVLLNQFALDNSPSREETDQIRKRLNEYNHTQTRGEYAIPGIEINLVLKNAENRVVGGIIVSTMLKVMHLEVLWVADECRGRGFGTELVLAAEKIGFENGCNTSQTWTFEFQGPAFYPKIGYKLIGVYDGYPNGLKEYVFTKPLGENSFNTNEEVLARDGFFITSETSKEEVEILHAGLRSYVDQFIGEEKNGIGINLVVRDQSGSVVGGAHAWTTIHNLLIEYVFVKEGYRNKGIGTKLLMEVEAIAKRNSCVAALVCPLSFHAPEFFLKMGFQEFGHSDGYPAPFREYYLIKKFLKNEDL